MFYRNLGHTDIKVSGICLGTMTWGSQNNEQDGHDQLDYALGEGINFIDTAEMYAGTHTEALVGQAIQDFDRAIQLNPNDATVFNNRGLAYDRLEQYQKAIQDYDRAIQLKPVALNK